MVIGIVIVYLIRISENEIPRKEKKQKAKDHRYHYRIRYNGKKNVIKEGRTEVIPDPRDWIKKLNTFIPPEEHENYYKQFAEEIIETTLIKKKDGTYRYAFDTVKILGMKYIKGTGPQEEE